MSRLIWSLLAIATLAEGSLRAETADIPDLRGWMARAGARVEAYFARAQSLVCEETVRIVPLGADLLPNGDHVRELVYELRVAWDAPIDASDRAGRAPVVLRQLLTVDGRPPRARDEPGCFDRQPVSPEPLAMLLPGRQEDYVFGWKGQGREADRASVTIEYRAAQRRPP